MYACIADVLGMMAAGGIRGGPAANISFKKAFALLEVCVMTLHDIIVCTIIRMFYSVCMSILTVAHMVRKMTECLHVS